MDALETLLAGHAMSARVFFTGALCEATHFDETDDAVGHLHLLQRGRLRLQPGDARRVLAAPALVYFARPRRHGLVPLPDEGDGEGEGEAAPVLACATVRLNPGLRELLMSGLADGVSMSLAGQPAMRTLAELLFAEGAAAADGAAPAVLGRQVVLDRLFEALLLMLLRTLVAERRIHGGALSGLADPRLARALMGMHSAPHKPWTVESLADEAAMSRAGFALRFKQQVGEAPLRYLMRWRMLCAAKLLEQGQPVKAVAPAVGYANVSAFVRAYGALHGESPARQARKG